MGHSCSREEIEGRKVTKTVPGFYEDVLESERIPEAPGGIMALLKKA